MRMVLDHPHCSIRGVSVDDNVFEIRSILRRNRDKRFRNGFNRIETDRYNRQTHRSTLIPFGSATQKNYNNTPL